MKIIEKHQEETPLKKIRTASTVAPKPVGRVGSGSSTCDSQTSGDSPGGSSSLPDAKHKVIRKSAAAATRFSRHPPSVNTVAENMFDKLREGTSATATTTSLVPFVASPQKRRRDFTGSDEDGGSHIKRDIVRDPKTIGKAELDLFNEGAASSASGSDGSIGIMRALEFDSPSKKRRIIKKTPFSPVEID